MRVEPHNFKIFKDGSEIQLEPKTFRLLLFLIENRTRLVEKSELLDAIWKDTFVTENALTREIAKLRKALGDDSKTPRYIQTVHTQGYRFIADVEETSETSSPENKKETENSVRQIKESPPDVPIPTATAQRKSSRQVFFLSLAALGILVALSLAAFFVWKSRQPKSETARNLKTAQITTWTSLDIYPAFSPDGNSIAYSSDHDGNFEIYVKPLTAGGRETQITSDGQQNFEPAFSPDGKFIAYYSKTSGGICIVPASGGKTKQITTFGSRPAWSPDGNSIAFQSDTITDLGAAASPAIPPSTIWIVSSHGGEPAQLTQAGNPAGGHGSPAWSPDGARIVFSASDFSGNSGSIWTVSGKGGDLRQLAQQASEPVFAPDGESVYYGSNLGLQKIRVSPSSGEPIGEPVQLMGNAPGRIRHFAVSADGKKIAYASLLITSNIWSVPVSPASNEATTEPAPLTQDRSFRKILPVFSPDGKRIAFQIRNVGGVSDIWLMDADGRNVAQITTEQANAPSWFPDGEQIAFLSGRQKHPQAWTTNLKTGQDKLLLDFGDDDVQYMRLSPEGKQIVFNSKKSGTTNVWTIQVEGGAAKQLTFDKELAGFACWSPDGKTLAFQIKRGDDTHVAIMPSDGGGEITQLTFDKGQSWASGFSPDGDKIAFAGFRNGVWNLYWVSLSTKQQKQLTNFAKLNSYVRYPAWSPLGNQIVYEYAETTGNIWIADLK